MDIMKELDASPEEIINEAVDKYLESKESREKFFSEWTSEIGMEIGDSLYGGIVNLVRDLHDSQLESEEAGAEHLGLTDEETSVLRSSMAVLASFRSSTFTTRLISEEILEIPTPVLLIALSIGESMGVHPKDTVEVLNDTRPDSFTMSQPKVDKSQLN